jgi:aminocarboxymuconate-semialdehyde decarboxylase
MPARLIDVHAHLSAPEADALLGPHPARLAAYRAMDAEQGQESAAASGKMLAGIASRLGGLGQRLDDMAARGVTRQLLSPSPAQYYQWADEATAEQVVTLQNAAVADACRRHPDSFSGLGTVALQHPGLAVRQLRDAMSGLGLAGAEISTHVNGESVAAARYEPFWQACDQLGALVLLHPLGTTMGTRLATYYLWNVIGQPLETTIALSELILGGHLDRYRRLRLLACHGGGYACVYWGRLDHAWRTRPDCGSCDDPPSSYLRRVYVDTVVHDPGQLRQLIAVHGWDHVVAGSDYPFDMGIDDVAGLIDAVPELTGEQKDAIRWRTAAGLISGEASE